MKIKKVFFISFLIFISLLKVQSQDLPRKIINFPDINGYKTLKCDFHMHTVYSDGTVWPTFRVEEAWTDGLDVIAITDHLGKSKYNHVNDTNFNKSYELAKPVAAKLGIVLIKGSEITMKFPYGHYNALFLKDINLIDKSNCVADLKAAKDQGAYIIWNHPGWKMKDEIPVWDSIPEQLMTKGLINGIEIVNYTSYYPLAYTWAAEKKLTAMAGSDIHNPATAEFDYMNGSHRPMTLVFAKDTSQVSIKDALEQHRTVVYYDNFLLGSEELLTALFNASVVVQNPSFSIDADSDNNYYNHIRLQNNSSIDFELELSEADKILKVTDKVTLRANSVTVLDIKPAPKDITGDKEYVLKYKVTNLLSSPGTGIVIEIPIKIKFL
jgi:3',5'-nucleoside bisphosphate phosphatase